MGLWYDCCFHKLVSFHPHLLTSAHTQFPHPKTSSLTRLLLLSTVLFSLLSIPILHKKNVLHFWLFYSISYIILQLVTFQFIISYLIETALKKAIYNFMIFKSNGLFSGLILLECFEDVAHSLLLEACLPWKDFPNSLPKSIGSLFHLLLYLSPSLKYWSSSCYHPLFSLLSMDLSSLVPPICPWFQLSPANPLCQATNLSRAPWLSFPVVFGICSWMAQRCLNKPCPKLNSSKPSFPVQSFSFPGDWCCHLPSSLGGGHLPTSESALTSESSLPGLKVLVSLYPKSPLN